MRVLITGAREWANRQEVWNALSELYIKSGEDTFIVVHGGARGADTWAHMWYETRKDYPGMYEEVHSVSDKDWKTRGRAAGIIRNQKMVDLGADICLAFPMPSSKGTVHCMRAAKLAGIPVINYGSVLK